MSLAGFYTKTTTNISSFYELIDYSAIKDFSLVSALSELSPEFELEWQIERSLTRLRRYDPSLYGAICGRTTHAQTLGAKLWHTLRSLLVCRTMSERNLKMTSLLQLVVFHDVAAMLALGFLMILTRAGLGQDVIESTNRLQLH